MGHEVQYKKCQIMSIASGKWGAVRIPTLPIPTLPLPTVLSSYSGIAGLGWEPSYATYREAGKSRTP